MMLKKMNPTVDTHLVPINLLFLAAEAPKGASLVVRDSTRGSPLTDAELKASLNTVGLLRPLLFKTFEEKQYIVSGNRRLRMLRELFADASPDKALIQVQNIDDFGGDWREVAMDENLSLPPHLVERYEMIVTLTKDMKLSAKDAQLRFGMTDRQFNQVMALGKMAPIVRQAWKAGEIDARTAQAFTLESDPKEQEKIFTSLKKSDNLAHHTVQYRIRPQAQQDVARLVQFVGTEAIQRAKLIKQQDFFHDAHIITDVKAVKKLAGDKLVGICQELIGAGWSWALSKEDLDGPEYNYGHSNPTGKPTDEDPGAGFSPAQRSKTGCIVTISHDGTLKIDYGRSKPADRKKIERAEKPKPAKKAGKAAEPVISNSLIQRLSETLEKGISAAMVATPDVAAAALIAGFGSGGHIIDVDIGKDTNHVKNPEADFVSIFEGAVKASQETKIVMLTQIAMRALSLVIYDVNAKQPIDDKAFKAMVQKMRGVDVQRELLVAFDAKNYFSSVGMPMIITAVKSAMSTDHAAKVSKMKKAAAVAFAVANVMPTGWLPEQLRTVHYKGPTETKSKPVKAAKKAKPAAKKKSKKK